MNDFHLQFCASPEWRQTIEETILPRALERVDLGADVLEIGPGPGFTTDVLMTRVDRFTAVEIDEDLGAALAARMAGTNVDVRIGDATRLEFTDHTFSGAASFHMLHQSRPTAISNRFWPNWPGFFVPAAPWWRPTASRTRPPGHFTSMTSTTPSIPTISAAGLTGAGFAAVDVAVYEMGWIATATA
jgi:SAM-dependent methyltransferase